MESNTGGASARKLRTHLVMASRHPAAHCRPVATGPRPACGLQGDERAPKVWSARRLAAALAAAAQAGPKSSVVAAGLRSSGRALA